MGSSRKIIVTVIFQSFCVLNEILCAWWDNGKDATRIFYADGPAKIRDYPHTVSIIASVGRTETQLLCGGFNIGTYNNTYGVVLTAGSCVNHLHTGRIPRENVYVRSNSEYWDCACAGTIMHGVKAWRLHPDYQEHVLPFIGTFSENDIGILLLKGVWVGVYNEMALQKPIEFDVPTYVWKHARGTTLGWGYTELANENTKDLRAAKNLVVISGEKCRKTYYKNYFPKNSYCIGLKSRPGKGPCAFDQGGPFFLENNTSSENIFNYILLGIASTAPICGDSSKPTIVVNTSAYIPFIKNLSWVDKIDMLHGTNANNMQTYFQPPSIAMDWKCKKSPMGGQLCCTSNKKKCVGIKKIGLWWWAENNDGVDDGIRKYWGGEKQNMWLNGSGA